MKSASVIALPFGLGANKKSLIRRLSPPALPARADLDHDFHVTCNTWCRERMERRSTGGQLSPEVLEMLRRTDGISRMLSHKVTEIEKAMPAMMTALSLIASQIAPNAGMIARRGRTAGEIWNENGFPKLKVTSWFSNRLVQMGCQIEGGGCGELGGRTSKLFDPDKARVWLDNGGRALVHEYIARRQGQKVLRLVPKHTATDQGAGVSA